MRSDACGRVDTCDEWMCQSLLVPEVADLDTFLDPAASRSSLDRSGGRRRGHIMQQRSLTTTKSEPARSAGVLSWVDGVLEVVVPVGAEAVGWVEVLPA